MTDEKMMCSGNIVSSDVKKTNFNHGILASQQPVFGKIWKTIRRKKLLQVTFPISSIRILYHGQTGMTLSYVHISS
jgi:hypothetical protein